MKETRIPFSDDLVNEIIAGRKTQTRRVIRPQPEVDERGYLTGEWLRRPLRGLLMPKLSDIAMHCPYGGIGDYLLGTEAWQHTAPLTYRADYRVMMIRAGVKASEIDACFAAEKWKSSRFMPKWASRLRLPITDVRVQRLQDISEEDARAEGVRGNASGPWGCEGLIEDFSNLWDRLNKKRGFEWLADPYVWVISFRRV